MIKTWHRRTESVLSAWISLVERFKIVLILLILGGAVSSLHYTLNHIGMDTSTKDMLSPDLQWRKLDESHDKIFPQYTDNLLVVVEAGTPDEASDAADLLYKRLLKETELFNNLYYPAEMPFFRNSSLLFLDPDDLQDLADNIASIQPFLFRLTEDQSLRGLFTMLSDTVQAKLDGNDIDLKSIPDQLDIAFKAVKENNYYRLSWQQLMSGELAPANKIYREFIILQPILNYDSLLPGKTVMHQLHNIITELDLTPENNIRVRLTDGVALSYEEMSSVSRGMEISTVLALIFVTILLFIGLRSFWSVLATLITLITGLVYTAFFASITVVNLNLISVAFAVLYIGLGVDFAIHFCLRYREALLQRRDSGSALIDTATHIGESLLLCAVTTAIGFYAFIPTEYDGVAELGLISGTGMFISLIITFTLLPALLGLFPANFRGNNSNGPVKKLLDNFAGIPVKQANYIRKITLLLTVASLIAVMFLQFDNNTLNLQPRDNESVRTYLDLLADKDTSPWTGVLLATSKNDAINLKQKLEKLPLVDKTVWIYDFIPEMQDDKLMIIEQMDLLLGSISTTSLLPVPDFTENLESIKSFNKLLGQLITDKHVGSEYHSLFHSISNFLAYYHSLSSDDQKYKLKKLERTLLATFPGRLDALIQSMYAEEISMDSLPEDLRSRWFHNGYYRIEIYPSENLNDNDAKRDFVNQIRAVEPQLIGSPVIDIEAGDTVVKAFRQALIYAVVTIIFLLLFLLDKKRDTWYVLVPLLLAILFTGAITVVLDIPLNFANIIALPLLMGIGVDSAIHILHRYRTSPPADGRLLATSSARAVLISALTTIFSIGNLAFSSHPGTASMGMILTIGISMTLICTLFILPSLLSLTTENKSK